MNNTIDIKNIISANIAEIKLWAEHQQRQNLALVGIKTGGAWVCDEIAKQLSLANTNAPALDVGYLDISFYRDDFSHKGLQPNVVGSDLPFDLEGRHILLIDDVIMSGRTIRAAMNALFDYGRPASIALLTVFDIKQRELPIQADICLQSLSLEPEKRVKLRGPNPLVAEIVSISTDNN